MGGQLLERRQIDIGQVDNDGIIRAEIHENATLLPRPDTIHSIVDTNNTSIMADPPDMQISAGTSCADSEKENFDTHTKSCHDQKFGVNENNGAYDMDTPTTLPLDDLSLVESDRDLDRASEPDQDLDSKEHLDLEVGPISISDENHDSTQNENSMTAITPIPAEHAMEPSAVGPAPDIERGIADSPANNVSNESQARVDNSYTVTWSAIARGEKVCGTTLPRFFWLAVLLGLLAVLCASVGYLMHSLRLLE